MKKTLVLISASPHSPNAKNALHFVHQKLVNAEPITVFFYGDGAYTANRLMWQTADVANIADEWATLATNYALALPVCVSTALARGITDTDNATRHQLDGENIRTPFYLVGLSELAMALDEDTSLIQF